MTGPGAQVLQRDGSVEPVEPVAGATSPHTVLSTRRGPAPAARTPGLLGVMRYVPPLREALPNALPDALPDAPPPRAAGPACDAWFAAGATLRRGGSEAGSWASDGCFSYGELSGTPSACAGDIETVAQSLYGALFAALAEAGTPHPLRLWNYLPRINECSEGLERYRRFNAGRQQAFVDAGRPAFEGAPAACALGSAEGATVLRFLAARDAPRALENPRQVSAYRYPAQYGARTPSFSRAALADAGGGRVALFVSGTASIVGHESVHAGDVRAQVGETVRNLRAMVAQANEQTRAAAHAHDAAFALERLSLVVYLRHAHDRATALAQLMQSLPAPAAEVGPPIVLQADICRSDLLVEIEGHAFTPGSLL